MSTESEINKTGQEATASTMPIHEALFYIQQNLNAPKDLENKFGNYKYRSCESILAAVKPHLAHTGTTLTFLDDIRLIGDRFYVVSTACLNNGVEYRKASGYAREDLSKKGMDGAQLTGATSSYARKYALNALFAIDDNKDADITNQHKTDDKSIVAQAKSEIQGAVTQAQLRDIFNRYSAIVPALCQKGGQIQKALTERRKVLEELNVQQSPAKP